MSKANAPALMSVVLWDIEEVIPYEKNAKEHSPEQVRKLAKAFKELGFDQPIVVDKDGVIIKGHGRRLAAIEAGFKKVPVVVRTDLSPEQVKAARLSDNRLSSLDYDTKMLNEELAELQSLNIDLGDLGFSDRELAFLTTDLGKLEGSTFVEDVAAATAGQAADEAAKVEAIEKKDVPLSQAFGFKTVPAGASRRVAEFVSAIEEQTGKKGAEALVDFVEGVLGQAA